jgi:cytochrome P450
MLQVLAKSFIFRSADFHKLAAVILLERFLPVLSSAAKNKHGLDVFELLRAVAAEIGSAYEMGLQNGLDITRAEHEQARKTYIQHGNNKVQEKNDHVASKHWLEAQMLEMCAKADAEIKGVKAFNTAATGDGNHTYPLAYSHLAAATAVDYPALSTSEKLRLVASELLDNLEATREGDGTILTYAMHDLSQRPMLQRQLRDELRAVSEGLKQAKTTRLLTNEMLQDIDRLPLLDAIVKETMRLRAPTPGPQRRVVPAGGVTVSDYYIPAGTIISTSQRTVHRNEAAFPEPDLWKPERWMSSDQDLGDRDPSKWWWAFGSGAMSCSGKDFALIGMFALTSTSHHVLIFVQS